jgi:hypothetical protein
MRKLSVISAGCQLEDHDLSFVFRLGCANRAFVPGSDPFDSTRAEPKASAHFTPMSLLRTDDRQLTTP